MAKSDSLVAAASPDHMDALERGRIVPDVVPRIHSTVSARFQLQGEEIECGEERPPSRTHTNFRFVIDPEGKTGDRALFTLLGIDPDPPLGLGPILHYAAVNLPAQGGELGSKGMAAASVLEQWRASRPPANTGLHRYVFLVYRQPSTLDFARAKSTVSKMAFDLEGWTARFGLGDPVHATYFVAGYECGCTPSTLMSLVCCAFCCWRAPSDDFHERAAAAGAAETAPLTGGAAGKSDAEEFA